MSTTQTISAHPSSESNLLQPNGVNNDSKPTAHSPPPDYESIQYPQLSGGSMPTDQSAIPNNQINVIADHSNLPPHALARAVQSSATMQEAFLYNVSIVTGCCDFERTLKRGRLIWLFLGLFGIHHLYLRRYEHFFWCILWLWMFGQMGYAPRVMIVAFGFYLILWIIDGIRLKSLIRIANIPYKIRCHEWSLYDIYLFWLPPYGMIHLFFFFFSYLIFFCICGYKISMRIFEMFFEALLQKFTLKSFLLCCLMFSF